MTLVIPTLLSRWSNKCFLKSSYVVYFLTDFFFVFYSPKYAIGALKKKMFHANPHTSFYSLLALESVVKNCGPPMHAEVSNKVNCETFAQLINMTQHENVKNKMLELIQTWAHAFRDDHKHRAIKDTMNILKCEGHKFPELKEADAMFTADVAPEWTDGEVCNRCRVVFSITQRKHHCRNCGEIFCGQCSSKSSRIPRFGIEKEVRVCDGCYLNLQKPINLPIFNKTEENLPEEYVKSSLAQQSQAPSAKSEQEILEEEELQLALALSQSEAEEKAKTFNLWQAVSYNNQEIHKIIKSSPSPEEVNNPELSRYLNRNYWEQKNSNQQLLHQKDSSPLSPTAPSLMSSIASSIPIKFSIDDPEMDEFVHLMKSQIEIFTNRMKSSSVRGRNITSNTSIQAIFLNISSLHSKLLSYIKELDDKRMWYESLQDKIGQIKDSRAALDVLRQEHQEKLRLMAEEQERQRQIQMALKLDTMRKKKQEYLQYQRHLALQRIQEQEREMNLRQEQQRAQNRMGSSFVPFVQEKTVDSISLATPGNVFNNVQSSLILTGNQNVPLQHSILTQPTKQMENQMQINSNKVIEI